MCVFNVFLYKPSAQRLIDHKLAQMDAQVLAGKQVEGMYLTYLLSCDKLTLGEVYICITELLLGGVDTVREKGHGRSYREEGGAIHNSRFTFSRVHRKQTF